MPTFFGHALSAVVLGHVYPASQKPARFWALAAACALLPDVDILAFSFGIPYDHVLGHRGLTHSLPFAAVVGVFVAGVAFRSASVFSRTWWGLALFFALVTASHGVLDAFTDGGRGIAFFAPFDEARHFFPWRPLRVSPLGIDRFLSPRGLATLKSEAVWIGIPSLLSLAAVWLLRGKGRLRRGDSES